MLPRAVVASILLLAPGFVVAFPDGIEPGGPHAPTLSLGNGGHDVAVLQLLLDAQGLAVAPLGLFDEATAAAVAAFQLSRGLDPTGIADEATWAALSPPLAEGSHGAATWALQKELQVKHNLSTDAPGIFGPVTAAAVASFQAHMGLPATGRADEATWRALTWHYLEQDLDTPESCVYYDTYDEWGASTLVWHLETAARLFASQDHGRVAIGDISDHHGGPLANHTTHQVGLDVDLRLIRQDAAQCIAGCRVDEPCYDRDATRALIDALVQAAHGHIVRIYLNDPALYGHHGVVRWAEGHEDHMHVRYCAAAHPDERYSGCAGASPSAIPLTGASEPPEWLPYREDFEHDAPWDFDEEIVQGNAACFGDGLGSVTIEAGAGRNASRGLVVRANEQGSTMSDHVYALKRLHDAPLEGRVRYEVHARIDPALASQTQTGPEIGLHTTRFAAPGVYLTSSAGFQYLPTQNGTWQIWQETEVPHRANWTRIRETNLTPGEWYSIQLDVDLSTQRYVQLRVRGPGVNVTESLAAYVIAEEAKPGFLSEGVVVSVEAENQWNTCGVGKLPPTQARVDYDDVALTRR